MANRNLFGKHQHSPNLLETIKISRDVALEMGYQYIDNLIFILAAIRQQRNGVAVALQEKGIDLTVLERLFKQGPTYNTNASLPLTKDFETALLGAHRFAEMYQSEFLETEHVVCSLMQKYDFSTMLLLHTGFDLFTLEMSLLKHGLIRQPVLYVPRQTAWQKAKNWVSSLVK